MRRSTLLGAALAASAWLCPALPGAAARTVDAQAEAAYLDPQGHTRLALSSNQVQAMVAAATARVRFFTDASFSRVAGSVGLNQRVFVEAEAPSCNSSSGIDAVSVQLYSQGMKQGEPLTAVETASGSGLFRGWADHSALLMDDTLQATLQGCSVEAQATTLVEPGGVVFDSEGDAPVAGARVTLIDVDGAGNGGRPGAPARVLSHDGLTPVASDTTTAPDGRFSFPQVAPGRYALRVESAAHSYPSKAQARQLTGRRIDGDVSFGAPFDVQDGGMPPVVDLPLDPLPRALRVQLTASRSLAEVAETVAYTAVVRNAGDTPLDGVVFSGRLPVGFAYLPGTLRRPGGEPVADFSGGRGPLLRLPLGRMAPGSSQTLTYRALIGATALQGDGRHAVQARAEWPAATDSNTARVKVEVQPGVFTDQAMVLGSVYADCNRNGQPDEGEPGVPGVRLVLQDGTSVTTDARGRYSLYGLRPATHVLKVDATTLPDGARLLAASARHAGDGASRFIDPRPAELHRADFAIDRCDAPMRTLLQERAARLADTQALDLPLRTELTPDGQPRALGDRRALAASGQVGAPVAAASPRAAAAQAPADEPVAAPTEEPTDAPAEDTTLQALAARLDATLDFIDLHDGQAVAGRTLLLRIKGRAGARLSLQINGQAVGDDRVGEQVQDAERGIALREYVGVALQPGPNTLVATEHDGFGNERARRSLTVRVPGAPATLVLRLPEGPLQADGQVAAVGLSLLDAQGLPVAGRVPVTLSASRGQWDVADLDPLAPGVQTFIESGRASLGLRAPAEAGDAEVSAQAGPVRGSATLRYAPALRPLLAVGLVEGTLDLRRLGAGALKPADDDGFAQALQAQAAGERSGARAAVYLKGKVRGDALLTLAYDADKDSRERLFRDIQPDAFYPVYGDASTKAFDAQSTGKLYVKLERDGASVLYGDFSTQPQPQAARQLGAYQRSLTGLRLQREAGALRGSAFASHDNARQQVIELPGNGTSGPFVITQAGIPRLNGERVEVLVRDRHQPARVLRSTPLQRFTDYDFDAFGGSLLLRTPVPSRDADLNPLSLRITLEVEQGGPAFWVAGADGEFDIGPRSTLGASVLRDWNPLQPFQMAGLRGTQRLGEHTVLMAEAVRTRGAGSAAPMSLTGAPEDEARRSGNGQRIELQHDGAALTLRAHAGRTDRGFANASSTLGAGRSEAGLKAGWSLDERTRLLAEVLHTADLASEARRDGLLLGVERSLGEGLKIELGGRHVQARAAAGTSAAAGTEGQPATTQTLRAKLSGVLPFALTAGATAYLEAEQDVHDRAKRLLAVGGDWQLAGLARLYARHELVSSLTGPYALDPAQRRHTTLVGIDMPAGTEGRGFGEYRARDAFSGREAEAAIGLRNRWPLAEGLRIDTSLERVHPLGRGDRRDEAAAATAPTAATAATAAIEYTASPLWKGTARLELRDAASGDSLLGSLGLARRLSDDWTLLGRFVRAQARSADGQPDRLQQRLQLGAALREGGARPVHALARYEFKREQGSAGGLAAAAPGGERSAHVLSLHADQQRARDLVITGHYAAKHAQESIDGLRVTADAQRLGGRLTWAFAERWDAGVSASVLGDARLRSRATAVGAELGWRVQDNLWLSLGHNLRGFHDRDLSADDATRRGSFVRLRFKFDERLLAALEP